MLLVADQPGIHMAPNSVGHARAVPACRAKLACALKLLLLLTAVPHHACMSCARPICLGSGPDVPQQLIYYVSARHLLGGSCNKASRGEG